MPIDTFLENLISKLSTWEFSVLPFLKAFLIIFLVGYLLFAGVVVRQVQLLNRVLGTRLSPVLRFFSWVHLVTVLILFLVTLFN